MTLLIESALGLSVVLAIVLAALPLLRRQSAAMRHCLIATALATGTLLPLFESAMPAWQVPVSLTSALTTLPSPVTVPLPGSTETAARAPGGSGRPASFDAVRLLAGLWTLGVAIALLTLLLGFARLRQMTRAARVLDNGRWREQLESVRSTLGIARPVMLLEAPHSRYLVVWGAVRPRVLLPAVAREWSDARIRLILTHELAHVRRGDWSVQCVAELLRAIFWFNPLVWIACARLRRESDRACDDLVLTAGANGSDYATHLVDVARALRTSRAWLPAPAIAHTTGFERRIQAMLNAHVNRRPLSRRTLALSLAICLTVALPLAALAAAQTLVSFTGAVLDPSNAALPNAVVTLTNTETQARYEVRTDREGRYEIPGLPQGNYVLTSSVPGFETVTLNLTVAGEHVQRDLKLDLGILQETITLRAGAQLPERQLSPEQKARMEEWRGKRAAETCPEAATSTPAIGGNIRVPAKLRDKRPIYPVALATSGVSGKVELQAVIGTDGRVEDIEVTSATHTEFADAAVEAVRQWEFDATLLNCVPVPTRMNVTANFEYVQ